MKIRLGYACISETLNLTTSSTYTYTNYLKTQDLNKLDKVIISNLENLEKILQYNIKNQIHFYRLSSKLIPLATKKEVEFDYIKKYKDIYQRLGKIIYDNHIRIDFHPDQFCVLNSIHEETVENSIEILKYHYQILDALNIKDKVLILHIGSNVFGKEKSLHRFIKNFRNLPKYLQEVIAIENDDKIFTIEDCIYLNKVLGIPIVLDYHHFMCNHIDNHIENYLDAIFSSWKGKTPKVHFSSPKNLTKKEIRSHHDYINLDDFISFIQIIKDYHYDIDIMIEAKKKDEALFRLVRLLKYKTDYEFIDNTAFLI